jgi:hypothetical protein
LNVFHALELDPGTGLSATVQNNRSSAAERSENRREAMRPRPNQDAPPRPGVVNQSFHSKSFFVCFHIPSNNPMKIPQVIPEEPNFDPKTRKILGDDAAAALYSRTYRPGWEPKV